ncbi:MAG: glutamine synthetase family protein [Actinomycetota bacterium]|nr:glutamine synthetase family protein [Actinomycetota bacterium]
MARNADERPIGEGGSGYSARPLLAADREGFVERHGLWDERHHAAAAQVRRVMDERGLERVRMSFGDQHGILRAKTITRSSFAGVLRTGLTVPSSLVLKDTSGRTAFPVFTPGAGIDMPQLAGVGDLVLVGDPATFRVLPWAPGTGWMLCDAYFPDGSRVPFDTRHILRQCLDRLADRGFSMTVGAELEFHVFGSDESVLTPDRVSQPGVPGRAPSVRPTTPGAQLLHEEGLDALDELVADLHRGLEALDLPLRSLELEFGASQLEITLAPTDAMVAADHVLLCRSAIRQLCRRRGLHATFMSRPAGTESASTGWHLHQSLRHVDSGEAAFVPLDERSALSATGQQWLAGLLHHAAAAAAFTTPTINGYKRFRPHSLAPDRVVWGRDNKGAMVRVIGEAQDPNTRLENRSGEPAANPYLYVASQVISGLDGIAARRDPGPATDDPYAADAARLPRTLIAALDALDASDVFEAALGRPVLDWFLTIKRAEVDRYLSHVSDWEQREYLGLF